MSLPIGNLLARYLNEHGFYPSTDGGDVYRLSIDKDDLQIVIVVIGTKITVIISTRGIDYGPGYPVWVLRSRIVIDLHRPKAFEEVLAHLKEEVRNVQT